MRFPQRDESTLWSTAGEGDSAAFGEIFDLHRDRVFGQALRLVRSVHDAEDITAVVFLEAWRRRAAVRIVDGSIIGWLLLTTNYVARNQTRSSRRYRAALAQLPPPEAAPSGSDDVDARLDSRKRESVVHSAFARLNKRDQDVLTLCVVEELTMSAAAAALDVPVGTVKSRLARAKARLGALTTETLEETSLVEGGAL
jgi:RNA polymerase sigma factor (sigma-70 family)